LITIAPVPANTSANVPINSAPHFFIKAIDRLPLLYLFVLHGATTR
jgi:hypothetical protein